MDQCYGPGNTYGLIMRKWSYAYGVKALYSWLLWYVKHKHVFCWTVRLCVTAEQIKLAQGSWTEIWTWVSELRETDRWGSAPESLHVTRLLSCYVWHTEAVKSSSGHSEVYTAGFLLTRSLKAMIVTETCITLYYLSHLQDRLRL